MHKLTSITSSLDNKTPKWSNNGKRKEKRTKEKVSILKMKQQQHDISCKENAEKIYTHFGGWLAASCYALM